MLLNKCSKKKCCCSWERQSMNIESKCCWPWERNIKHEKCNDDGKRMMDIACLLMEFLMKSTEQKQMLNVNNKLHLMFSRFHVPTKLIEPWFTKCDVLGACLSPTLATGQSIHWVSQTLFRITFSFAISFGLLASG